MSWSSSARTPSSRSCAPRALPAQEGLIASLRPTLPGEAALQRARTSARTQPRQSPLQSDSVSTDRQRNSRPPRQADFSLSMGDLRSVTAFTSAAAEVVLPHFELSCPDDDRPRQALATALAFVQGAPRSRAQRVSAPADPVQVEHILRAPAHAVRVLELTDGPDSGAAPGSHLDRFTSCATPQLRYVLRRYPRISATPNGTSEKSSRISHRTNRINRLMSELDERLRRRSASMADPS